MVNETVQAVRNAELKAAEKENEALRKKEELLSKAQNEAKDLITSKVKEANLLSEKKLKAANESSAVKLEAAKLKADQEVLLLQEMVKGKEQVAIDFIISSLI